MVFRLAAYLIPAASSPAQDCFTRLHQTCRPTSFNRSFTGNDVLWSLFTVCIVATAIFGQGVIERKLHAIFLLGAKVLCCFRSWEWKFHLWNFRSWEQKYVGMKVPVTLPHSFEVSAWRELSFWQTNCEDENAALNDLPSTCLCYYALGYCAVTFNVYFKLQY